MDGGKTSKKPRPLTSAEKLETQNGIKKRRNVGQKPGRTPAVEVLMSSAMPMMPEMPSDVIQSCGLGSK